jgi:hypothetical protein
MVLRNSLIVPSAWYNKYKIHHIYSEVQKSTRPWKEVEEDWCASPLRTCTKTILLSYIHPPSYPMGTGALSLGVKQPGCETDHSPASSAEVKMRASAPLIPQYVFMAWCLVKHREFHHLSFINLYLLVVWTDGGKTVVKFRLWRRWWWFHQGH